MKKTNYFILIILTIIFSSCATQKDVRNKLLFAKDYKKVYFRNCLRHGYNNSKSVKKILEEDFSIYSDYAQGTRNYRIIDSLAAIAGKKIKKDSIEFFNIWQVKGKMVLAKCLNDYTSKWLDSMAKTAHNLKVKKYKHYSKYK